MEFHLKCEILILNLALTGRSFFVNFRIKHTPLEYLPMLTIMMVKKMRFAIISKSIHGGCCQSGLHLW